MSKEYIAAPVQAKMMRAALKQAFPGIKFRVVCSRGGSIDVSWTDGPNDAQVQTLVKRYEGGYFDGMIDYAGSRYVTIDGKPSLFMAKYVFTCRAYSDAMIQRAISKVVSEWGASTAPAPAVVIENYRSGNLYNTMPEGAGPAWDSYWNYQQLINRDLQKRTSMLAQPSPEAERVKFLGDDGYGRGTVGQPGGNGGEQCYKAQSEARERIAAAFERLEAPGPAIIMIQASTTVQ